jgi:2-iminobutanoate/2-iminopropanoate deaminase
MQSAIHHPEKNADTGAYSAGVLCAGWLYVSGHASLDMASGEVLSGTIEQETQYTLEHIEKVIRAAGGTRRNIVKCTVHLVDINDFDAFDRAYRTFFKDVEILPARTTVGSQLPDIKIEIDAIAYIPGKSA